MKKIVIYTGIRCAHCDWAKALLHEKKLDFTEHNISIDPTKRDEMLKRSNGAKTVPQIFIGDYHVGGNKELQKLEKQGKLDNLI